MVDQSPEFEGTQEIGDYPVKIKGGTDGTIIGNIGDRQKVDALFTGDVGSLTTSKKIVFEDAQLARYTQPALTVWTNIYSYTGSGKFYGSIVNLEGAGGGESDKWFFNIIFDTTFKMFGNNGILIDDVINNNVYDIKDLLWLEFSGLGMHDNCIRIDLKNDPVVFSSQIEIKIKRITTLKKFKAGLIKIAKD